MRIAFGFATATDIVSWGTAIEGRSAAHSRLAGAWASWIAELVGGALILIGLMTRPAAFLCSGHMAAAYWIGHGMNAVLPIANHGELAVMFCFTFLFIAAHGPGIWSVDAMRSGD